MLTSLLPGLRQLRAPLAAGFLWLIAIWLTWSHLGTAGTWGGWRALRDVRDQASPLGKGVALTFTAYLVGVLTGPTMRLTALAIALGVRRVVLNLLFAGESLIPLRVAFRLSWGGHETLLAIIDERVPTGDAWAESPIAARLVAASRRRDETLARWRRGDLMQELMRNPDSEPTAEELQQRLDAAIGFPEEELNRTRREWVGELELQCLSDLRLVRSRLATANLQLFNEVDRDRGEAEFRLLIWAPLTAAILAFAARSGWGWPAMLGTVVVAVGASTTLILQGYLTELRANAALIDGVRAGFVDFPTLERLFPRPDGSQSVRAEADADAVARARPEHGAPGSVDG